MPLLGCCFALWWGGPAQTAWRMAQLSCCCTRALVRGCNCPLRERLSICILYGPGHVVVVVLTVHPASARPVQPSVCEMATFIRVFLATNTALFSGRLLRNLWKVATCEGRARQAAGEHLVVASPSHTLRQALQATQGHSQCQLKGHTHAQARMANAEDNDAVIELLLEVGHNLLLLLTADSVGHLNIAQEVVWSIKQWPCSGLAGWQQKGLLCALSLHATPTTAPCWLTGGPSQSHQKHVCQWSPLPAGCPSARAER